MRHLRHSIFISTKKLELDIEGLWEFQIANFFVGTFSDQKISEEQLIEFSISFETLGKPALGANPQNTAIIRDNLLVVTGSDMNTQSIYYIIDRKREGGIFVVFNDLFLARYLLKSMCLSLTYNSDIYSTNLTFFERVNRLLNSEQICIRIQGRELEIHKKRFSDILKPAKELFRDISLSKDAFFDSLNCAVKKNVENETTINIALSGGIDSATIAWVINQHNPKLKAYTVSTDWGNEYKEAKETADFLGIELEMIHLTKDEIINEIPNIIRFFYFKAAENIEIALVAQCLYKKLYDRDKSTKTFLTGYGSDLLNAGVFLPFNSYNELQDEIIRRLRKTQISNEFNNLGALNYGVKTHHPFWQREVISLALQIPAVFKVVNGQDKFYFRDMMVGRLPDNTVWRKKLGAHHGTGLAQYLKGIFKNYGNASGDPENGYRYMIRKLHQEIFFHGHYG